MAATFSKESVSGSANYNLINITAACSPGVIIHTGTSLTAENSGDELWIWGTNIGTSLNQRVTFEWGGAAACIIKNLNGSQNGLELLIPGIPVRAGNVIRAYGNNASLVSVLSYVNYIRP